MFGELFKEMLTLIGGLIVIYFVYIIISKKNDKTTTNTASMAQIALKELVERVVEEAKTLPGLRSSKSEKEKEPNSSFEDLLATAILNKVLEKFQNEYVDGNRNVLPEKSSSKRKSSEIETSFEKGQEHLSLTIEERIEEVEEENDVDFSNVRRVPFPEYGMDIVSQDSGDENQEEFIHDLVTPIESWEENWLFQKRKMQIRSESVSMLVPHPSEDYRALIGDQDVEDIPSDDEIEHELKYVISNVTESSNSEETNREKSSSPSIYDHKTSDKIVENGSDEKNDNFESDRQDDIFFAQRVETEEIPEDQIQQESEYTEHFDTATQKHMDSLTKTYGPMGIDEVDHEESPKITENSEPTTKIIKNEVDHEKSPKTTENSESTTKITKNEVDHEKSPKTTENSEPTTKTLGKCRDSAAFIKSEQTYNGIDDEVKLATPPRPGTIAEREHRKWENARPIKNNPYSKKNIQKRLLERQYNCHGIISERNISNSPEKPLQIILGAKNVDFKRFARDYYINDAITSNGEKESESEKNQHTNSENIVHSNGPTVPEGQSKVSSHCQKNNEETSRGSSEITIAPQNWKTSEVEKLLEKERRNNKNEINARFNNKESKNHRDINYETSKSSQKRVVNKLDLKSFGYECGLRRSQSIQLDSRNHSQTEQKPKIVREKNEFTRQIENHEGRNFDYTMGGMFSAKSVPNIADLDFSNGDKPNGIEGKMFLNSVENISTSEQSDEAPILPCVRKLARAFSKSAEINHPKVKKEKKRPTTPEIHLVERPEKLELKTCENRGKSENNKPNLIGDISIISPGKLKNNIQFWEQLQKQS